MKVRTLSIIVAAIAALTMAGCSLGSRGDDASSATTTSPTTSTIKPKVTEGSFAELRKTCTDEDRKIFNAIVRQFNEYPKVTDTPATAPFSDELRFILANPTNGLYAAGIALSPDDSCLKAFEPYLPLAQPTSGGSSNRGSGGGNGGGTGNGGTGNTTQPTAGGSDCSGGMYDPDGPGPIGCTVKATPVPVATDPASATQPAPPATTTAPTTTQPAGAPAPVDPPATATPGECWIIDGVPQGNCN